MNTSQAQLCSKCGSSQVIGPVVVAGDLESPIPLQLKLKPPKEVGAWLAVRFPESFALQANVCGNCGHTELYTPEFEQLWQKWQKGFR